MNDKDKLKKIITLTNSVNTGGATVHDVIVAINAIQNIAKVEPILLKKTVELDNYDYNGDFDININGEDCASIVNGLEGRVGIKALTIDGVEHYPSMHINEIDGTWYDNKGVKLSGYLYYVKD